MSLLYGFVYCFWYHLTCQSSPVSRPSETNVFSMSKFTGKKVYVKPGFLLVTCMVQVMNGICTPNFLRPVTFQNIFWMYFFVFQILGHLKLENMLVCS